MIISGRMSLSLLVLLRGCWGGGSNDPTAPADPNETQSPVKVNPADANYPTNSQIGNSIGSTWTIDESRFESDSAASFQQMVLGIDRQVRVVVTDLDEAINAVGFKGSQ